jgi:hypothetical protein
MRRIDGHAGALRALAELAGRRKSRADALLLARLALSDRAFRPELGG